MEKPTDPSLLQEYRSEFTHRFAPLQLWSDRRRILADPAIAVQAPPPLANSPVRFALSLQLVPVIFIGWLVSAVVGLLVPDEQRMTVYAGKLTPAIELLEARLDHPDDAQLAALRQQGRVQDLHPQATALWNDLVKLVAFRAVGDAASMHDAVVDWLHRLDASEMGSAHRQTLQARALGYLYNSRENERFNDSIMRSITEGGVLMQVVGVFSLLFSAWLLGRMLRGDARFVLAGRADRFYLYYATSLIFWFLLVNTICFGVGSYAYASGRPDLFTATQIAQTVVSLAAVVWLLSRSGEMARVLCQTNPAPKGAAFAVAWRIVAASLASIIVMLVIALIIGVAVGVGLSVLKG